MAEVVNIYDWVRGNSRLFAKDVIGIPSGTTLSKAWFTVKHSYKDVDPGLLQVAITPTSDLPTVGQITDIGTGDQIGHVKIRVTGTQSAAFPAGIPLYYDISVLLSDGQKLTPVIGRIRMQPGATLISA